MIGVEKRFVEFIEKNFIWILYIFITVVALTIRYQFLDWKSADYTTYLEPWFLQLKDAGGLRALAAEIGNYNVLYLLLLALLTYIPLSPVFLIKSLSVVFEFIGAATAAYLCRGKQTTICNFTSVMVYGTLLILPNIFINSSVWAQCDFSYSSLILLSIFCMTKEKFRLAIVSFGLAFCFKLQAIFFLPVLLVVYMVKKKFSVLEFLWWPVMWILTSAPALLMGRSLVSIASIYKNQVTLYNWMTLYYPNIYCIFQDMDDGAAAYENFSKMAICLTVFILASGCVYAVRKKIVNNLQNLLGVAAWCAFTCVMFLPAMHERYGFLAEVLVVCFAFSRKDLWTYVIAIMVNGVAIVNYVGMMFWTVQVPYHFLALMNVAAYAALTYLILRMGIWEKEDSGEQLQLQEKEKTVLEK